MPLAVLAISSANVPFRGHGDGDGEISGKAAASSRGRAQFTKCGGD